MGSNRNNSAVTRKPTSAGRLKAEATRHKNRAYRMWRLAVLRRGRIVKLMAKLSLVKSLAWASFGLNIGMAILIAVLVASRN